MRSADTDERVIVTSARHYNALSSAVESLRAVVRAVRDGISEELLAEDLRAAIRDINSIFASTSDAITPGEVLGEVFGKFCVGNRYTETPSTRPTQNLLTLT